MSLRNTYNTCIPGGIDTDGDITVGLIVLL
jgi:hypothetical protein